MQCTAAHHLVDMSDEPVHVKEPRVSSLLTVIIKRIIIIYDDGHGHESDEDVDS